MDDLFKNTEYGLYFVGILCLIASLIGRFSIKGVAVDLSPSKRTLLGLLGVTSILLGLIPRIAPSGLYQPSFGKLETELRLDGTSWRGDYEDVEDGKSITRSGFIKFKQNGSRITGSARASEAERGWLIEGVAYKGRLCYIYVDGDPNVTSIGTASFELNSKGNTLSGQWTGWSPDGNSFEPRKITLTKIK